MKELKDIFSKEKVEYDEITKYIKNGQREDINFIIENIIKFDEEHRNKILEEILQKSDSQEFTDNICMKICEYVEYEYTYYKKIAVCVAKKMHYGRWGEEIRLKIIEDGMALNEVFVDFSKREPEYKEYDIAIIGTLLERYNEKYMTKILLERENAISVCKKLITIVTIHQINILNIYCFFDRKFKFVREEYQEFIEDFCFNYMYNVRNFLKSNTDDSEMISYLKEIYDIRKEQNKEKNELKILAPNNRRIIEYMKHENKRSLQIRKAANKQSIFLNIFKTSTILYGGRYGMIRRGKNKDEILVNNYQTFSYNHEYPLEYILDPAKYIKNKN